MSFVAAAGSRPWLAEIVSEAIEALQAYIARQIRDPQTKLQPLDDLSPERAARLIVALLNGLTLDLLAAPQNTRYAKDDLEHGVSLILERG